MAFLALEKHRNLFASDGAFSEFLQIVEKAAHGDGVTLLANQKLVGTWLSPEATRLMLQDRILGRLTKNPELLDEIADRLENDPVVD
jgi:hypothetical protein